EKLHKIDAGHTTQEHAEEQHEPRGNRQGGGEGDCCPCFTGFPSSIQPPSHRESRSNSKQLPMKVDGNRTKWEWQRKSPAFAEDFPLTPRLSLPSRMRATKSTGCLRTSA